MTQGNRSWEIPLSIGEESDLLKEVRRRDAFRVIVIFDDSKKTGGGKVKIEDMKKFRELSKEDKILAIMDALSSEDTRDAVKMLAQWVAEIAKA